MASLGEEAARVRVRQLADDEAFLLGALHLQALRRRGVDPSDPDGRGHVQDLGLAWRTRARDLPAWVAEHDDKHVGMAICRLPALPHVGHGRPELVALEPLGAPGEEAVGLALVRAVVAWAGHEGHPAVEVAADLPLPPTVLDAARADVAAGRRLTLPTRL